MHKLLEKLYQKQSLTIDESASWFSQMLAGELSNEQISASLIALKMKGEVADEITGLVQTLRAAAVSFDASAQLAKGRFFADCCGTGGDGLNTFNISTASSLVAGYCGLPMVKHGNRSVSSNSGSADIIERLGIPLDLAKEASEKTFQQTGYSFLFAPHYHPLMKHVAPVRQALATSTIFNLAGPLANPAAPNVQLMGVPRAELVEPLAQVLVNLGCERGLVVHGGGLDELCLHADTNACLIDRGKITPLTIKPADAGLDYQPLSHVQLSTTDDAFEVFNQVINGQATKQQLDIVAFNAGTLLWVAEQVPTIRQGYEQALSVLQEAKLVTYLDHIKQSAKANRTPSVPRSNFGAVHG